MSEADDEYFNHNEEDEEMSFRNRGNNRGRKENDGKYLRLTGLWPSKKNDALWTGKFRNQDLEKLIEKCEEADKAGADLVVFLWENTDKEGKKDPDFTVQVSVSEDDGNSRGRGRSSSRRSSRNDRDDNDGEDNDSNEDDNNEESNEEEAEEKPSRRNKSSKEESKGRSKSRSTGKRDKNDW